MGLPKDTSIPGATRLGGRLHETVLFMEAAAERCAASSVLVVSVFTILYLLPTIQFAAQKMLWVDEFFTLYLSTVPNWGELLRALGTGADQHPPSFYYLTHLCLELFGCTPVTVRLPEIFGFWLMCVALYALFRRLLPPIWGVLAMMLPLSSGAYYYGSEARGYGLMLGFSALALYAWFEITAGRRRVMSLAVLAVSSAAAVASHYYAVIAVLALGIGEIVRTIVRKKFDAPVWAAFGGSAIPLLVFASTIRTAREYSVHFWAVPVWSEVFSFYGMEPIVRAGRGPHLFGYTLNVLLGCIGVAVLIVLALPRASASRDTRRAIAIPWFAASAVAMAIAPVFTMILAKFVTHGYSDRYAIVAVIGTTVLIVYGVCVMARQRTAVAAAAIVVCGLCFYINQRDLKMNDQFSWRGLKSDFQLLNATQGEPVAVSDGFAFYRLSFYSPPAIYRRLTYVADAHASLEYLHSDTLDRGLLDLSPWFPLDVVPLRDYVRN
ncbi:MAG: glycosyltransferase family 39 protein, partial [Acidobacteriaceae bacterium]|nr:glycosyltransferase family 39 protein [Acidobacteriaceae bacterium]